MEIYEPIKHKNVYTHNWILTLTHTRKCTKYTPVYIHTNVE